MRNKNSVFDDLRKEWSFGYRTIKITLEELTNNSEEFSKKESLDKLNEEGSFLEYLGGGIAFTEFGIKYPIKSYRLIKEYNKHKKDNFYK